MMYYDSATSFQALHFQLFTDVVNDHSYSISQEWVTDLNNRAESLGFRIHGHTYSAHMVDPVSGEKKSVSKEDFCALISSVKGQCAQGCHADVFRRTDGRTSGRSDDGRGGVRDLDAL
jgi:hypothetical protein